MNKNIKRILSASMAMVITAGILTASPILAEETAESEVTQVFSDNFEDYTKDINWIQLKTQESSGVLRPIIDTSKQDKKVKDNWRIYGSGTSGAYWVNDKAQTPSENTFFGVVDDPTNSGHGAVLKIAMADRVSGDYRSPVLTTKVGGNDKKIAHESGKNLSISAQIYITDDELNKLLNKNTDSGYTPYGFNSLIGVTGKDYFPRFSFAALSVNNDTNGDNKVGLRMGHEKARSVDWSSYGLGNASTYADWTYYDKQNGNENNPWFKSGKWVTVEYVIETSFKPQYNSTGYTIADYADGSGNKKYETTPYPVDTNGDPKDKYMTYRLYIDGQPVCLKRDLRNNKTGYSSVYENTYDLFGDGEGYFEAGQYAYDKGDRLGEGFYGISFAPQAKTQETAATYYVDNIEIKYVPALAKKAAYSDNTAVYTFNNNLAATEAANDASNYKIKDSNGEEIESAVTAVAVNGKTLTLTYNQEKISADMEYTVEIPAGTLTDEYKQAVDSLDFNISSPVEIENFSGALGDAEYKASFKVKKNKPVDKIVVIMAAYGDDNKLLGVAKKDINEMTFENNAAAVGDLTISGLIKADVKTVKLFVWDSIGSMTPYQDAYTAYQTTTE